VIEDIRVAVGDHGLELPPLGLGTAALGNLLSAVSEREAIDTLENAYEHGIRYFDTAPLYGHGLSEQRLASSVSRHPREDLVISTKVGRLLRAGGPRDESQYFAGESFYKDVPDAGPVWDFSYDGILTSLEESLQRLDLDRIDILNLHDPDEHYDEASTSAFDALQHLRTAGTVRAIGAGANHTAVLTRLVENCDLDLVLLAGRYTLLDQSSLADLMPACRTHSTSVIIGGVFNSGILIDPTHDARFDYIPASGAMLAKAQQIRQLCDRHGIPLPAAAIQFPLAHPQVASVLIGARSVAELDMDMDLLAVDIPAAFWHDLRSSGLVDDEAPLPED
jgi:D-threo-aldose 1-dehydrogenase